jgi:hypothetical protein
MFQSMSWRRIIGEPRRTNAEPSAMSEVEGIIKNMRLCGSDGFTPDDFEDGCEPVMGNTLSGMIGYIFSLGFRVDLARPSWFGGAM